MARRATSSQLPILLSLTGDRELDRKLSALARNVQSRIARRAVNKGVTVILNAQRRAAPNKALRKSLGKSNKRSKRLGVVEAKAGINVGKRPSRVVDGSIVAQGRQFPQAHLLVLGTAERYTTGRRGGFGNRARAFAQSIKRLAGGRAGYRGRIKPRRFIESASMGAANEAAQVAAASAWNDLRALAAPELKAI